MKRNDNNNDGWRVRNNKILAMRNCCPAGPGLSLVQPPRNNMKHFAFPFHTSNTMYRIRNCIRWSCLALSISPRLPIRGTRSASGLCTAKCHSQVVFYVLHASYFDFNAKTDSFSFAELCMDFNVLNCIISSKEEEEEKEREYAAAGGSQVVRSRWSAPAKVVKACCT